jgi:molybdopterin/thiamine biosynthesis adenylyltransferase
MLDRKNIPELVERIDVVVDSIDFLDAAAILALHREARRQKKPVISPIAAGWGGAALVFHPDGMSFHELVGLAEGEIPDGVEYTSLFLEALSRLGDALPAYVAEVVRNQFQQIRERRPCPMSQLGAGTFSAASLTATLLVRVLLGQPVPLAPSLIVIDPLQAPCAVTAAASAQ